MTREEAAAFFGVALRTWSTWESEDRITIPRYAARHGTRRAIYYALPDLETLREAFRRLGEPHEDPDLPGVYRVPIRSRLHTMHALIDAQDLPKVQGRKWNWSPRNGGRRGEVVLATTGKQTPLKRIVLGLENAGKATSITYANGDPLDLRRINLVILTTSERCRAARKPSARAGCACSSKYRGVTWDKPRRMWKAQIFGPQGNVILGRFGDEVEAALAYDDAARALLGAQANPNFPGGRDTAPPRTGLDPWGAPVRAKCKYRVTPPLRPPPEGMAVVAREQAAELMGVRPITFHHWEREGRIAIPRYRLKPVTGTPILYAVTDLQRLRDDFAKEGQPYEDPQDAGIWRVPIWTRTGYIEALVDAADREIVRGKVWVYSKRKNVCEAVRREGGDGVVILSGPRDTEQTPLKRIIMGVKDAGLSFLVVHANGNPLDCRRGNLIVRTAAQRTRRAYKLSHRGGEPTTSIYKGVCWIEREGAWQAQIRVDDKPRKIGLFDSEEAAARAYDEAARDVWGVEARVNFPEPGELPTAIRDTKVTVSFSTSEALKSMAA